MGMSASQARLLSITSRMNDVEFKSQQISNTKIRLADESEQVANDYTKALNKQKFTYTDYSSGSAVKQDLNSSNLGNYGFTLKSRTNATVPEKFTAAQLYEMIESGQFYLEGNTTTTTADGVTKPSRGEISVSSNTQLAIESDTTELAKAEAEYNAKTAKINNKEKLLDNDLKALDTEHSALKTEYDSVKSLISDNVSKSFNLFS